MNNFNADLSNVINQEQPNTALMTIDDKIAMLREKVSQPVTQWQPYDGDVLLGELVDRKTITTQYGAQEVFIVKTQEGELISYFLNKYIEGQLRLQGAKYGSAVAVTFLGKAETSSGKKYNQYQVMVVA